ncbi:MAG TPA: gfo/Idh/MocA family oxidoreductase, partial [Pirellulaceae bacterium]
NGKVRFACELVRNGYLGEVRRVEVNLPCDESHHQEARTRQGRLVPAATPRELDYDVWLGHTPQVPYAEHRCHFWWRFHSRYGGGEMTDRGAHVIDLVQLALHKDATGPIRFEATGKQLQGGLYDACLDFEFENTYADGTAIVGRSNGTRGCKFIGTEGSLFIHVHGGELEAEPKSLLSVQLREKDQPLGRTEDHRINFLDCVRSRETPFASAEIGHRTATICHLNNLALRLGRAIQWDPVREQIEGDAEANGLLLPTMRKPWSHLWRTINARKSGDSESRAPGT